MSTPSPLPCSLTHARWIPSYLVRGTFHGHVVVGNYAGGERKSAEPDARRATGTTRGKKRGSVEPVGARGQYVSVQGRISQPPVQQ